MPFFKKARFSSLFFVSAIFMLIYSCEYKNEEELFPEVVPSNCDTVDVSYSAIIQPIFNRSCAFSGCHDDSGASNSFGINLSSWQNADNTVSSVQLLRSIKHTGNFPMPKGAAKLPPCEIQQIESWINNGRKNN